MEGPADKTVTFIGVDGRGRRRARSRALHGDVPELAYLGGHPLGELLDIERRATAGALARRGRPNMTLTLDRVDPWHVGALLMFLELATAYAGRLYGVDAFDQPGVELGKQFTYAMLGRADADEARRGMGPAAASPIPSASSDRGRRRARACDPSRARRASPV